MAAAMAKAAADSNLSYYSSSNLGQQGNDDSFISIDARA
jgi:hypothetical protein